MYWVFSNEGKSYKLRIEINLTLDFFYMHYSSYANIINSIVVSIFIKSNDTKTVKNLHTHAQSSLLSKGFKIKVRAT